MKVGDIVNGVSQVILGFLQWMQKTQNNLTHSSDNWSLPALGVTPSAGRLQLLSALMQCEFVIRRGGKVKIGKLCSWSAYFSAMLNNGVPTSGVLYLCKYIEQFWNMAGGWDWSTCLSCAECLWWLSIVCYPVSGGANTILAYGLGCRWRRLLGRFIDLIRKANELEDYKYKNLYKKEVDGTPCTL